MAGVTLKQLLTQEDASERIKELKFEEGLKLLEELVAQVESGSLSLDLAIGAYERGSKLVEQLRSLLSGAEEKLKILERVDSK